MKIINESNQAEKPTPYVVGTPNATEDVFHHIKPGRKRANFFRYFRFNLPRLTKAALMLQVATIAACATSVALSSHLPFAHGDIALWIIVSLCAIYLALAVFTRNAIWDFGSLIASGVCVIYLGGLIGNAPLVSNGASIPLAATWNLMFFTALVYFVFNWAINFGILVVWPKTQGFVD